MAAKKKSSHSETAAKKPVKAAAKTKRKGVVKATPKKRQSGKRKSGKRKSGKRESTKRESTKRKIMAAADADPTGCCTFTNSAGQLMMRNMRQSQCAKITGSTFEAGIKCNG